VKSGTKIIKISETGIRQIAHNSNLSYTLIINLFTINKNQSFPFSRGVFKHFTDDTGIFGYCNSVISVVVRNHPKFSAIYHASSEPFKTNSKLNYERNIYISDENTAGAFNIYAVLVSGVTEARLRSGKTVEEVDAYWQTGVDNTDTIYCKQSVYDSGKCNPLGAILISGNEIDRDQFDDHIILAELFKLLIDRYSVSDAPGGTNNGARVNPLSAWETGASMFFASDVTKTSYFLNRIQKGVYHVFNYDSKNIPFMYFVIFSLFSSVD